MPSNSKNDSKNRSRRKNVLRVDSTIRSAEKEIEKVFGLPDGSMKLVNPDGRKARSDKRVGALLKDWGW
jgi:hypothetical protein